MLHIIETINTILNNFIWGIPAMICIFGVGLYLSIKTNFLQIRKFPYAIQVTLGRIFRKKDASDGAMTPFQAVCTALAATVGTGNIAGVAGAIAIGGPGAVFWMWFSAILGMCTKFSEVTLAVHFREVNEHGDLVGGPMYYISKGLNMKFLGILYAVLLLVQNSGGTLIQGNVIKDIFHDFMNFPPIITSVVVGLFIGFVITGGLKRLVKTMDKIVPFMTCLYFIAGLLIIGINIEKIPELFSLIFKSAFGLTPAIAGAMGFSVKQGLRYGISRGIYSNESGEGTAAIFYSKITENDCKDHGLYGIMEVFIDTMIVCTISGLVSLLYIDYSQTATPIQVMVTSFESIHYSFKYFLGLSMVLFGMTSILGQWILGKESFKYITDQFISKKDFTII